MSIYKIHIYDIHLTDNGRPVTFTMPQGKQSEGIKAKAIFVMIIILRFIPTSHAMVKPKDCSLRRYMYFSFSLYLKHPVST